jgi:ferredoxin
MRVIKRNSLTKWLQNTAKSSNLVAPQDVHGVLLYRSVKDVKDIVWDYIRPVLSAKEFFFPPTDRLFSIEIDNHDVRLIDTISDKEQVLFGVRPCDSRGLLALDALFIDSEPPDLNYAARRGNAAIIGMACTAMGESCFCTTTGGAPNDPSGMDIMLERFDGGFIVHEITPKGQEIVQKEWQVEEIDHVHSKPVTTKTDLNFQIPAPETWTSHFDDEYWEMMAGRCLSCRICAYVCPTCRCFDVRDEPVRSDNGTNIFERLRCWDSCAGEVYRRIAGGHNPRSEKGQRLRNRFFCKFYYYPEQYQVAACTGCGRCIDSCPVNIDITEVLDHVKQRTT